MADSDILTILKVDLQIAVNRLDEYLLALIQSARRFITQEGITLSDSMDDAVLVEMYAAYLYRRRREENAAMPRMLRYALNNRLLSEKGGQNKGRTEQWIVS